ncbi:TetR/AcrR family transcriptional regulator [Bacillus sp. EB106-08-02-XG196]|uniref:TetR/AcrR family transcriptional regulator n=1 Tax=Bacillus sp. EB106-08-02-XG196 TaxID=2737049 RepID=UPI0015C4D8CC|nr:TetR/AcrR family transcriptional regulator [Bacillus sp. EB106-08-02-XG196]NWQ41550.1 TetR/AcrR family transcriptional regulator [Bacillus sp. EB106-08-02-XG196]
MSDREEQLVGEFPLIPKQERAQIKRDLLLKSGHELFVSRGFEHTTAKEIAAHAGVATGTFYRYFSDKRQLLMSLLEDQIEMLMPPEPKWGVSDPESTLASLLESHDERLKEIGLQRLLPELLAKDTEFAEVLAAGKRKIFTRILSGLKRAYDNDLTWNDLDLNTVTWSVMILAEHAHEKMKHCGNQTDYREVAKVMCRIIFPPEVMKQLRTNGTVTKEE